MISLEGGRDVGVLRLEHGKVNAFDVEVLDALTERLGELARNETKSVVLASGLSVFSAGIDLQRVLAEPDSYVDRLIAAINSAFVALVTHPAPTVAAVAGPAVAGGCVLACACDVRVIATDARMGATELAVGVPFPAASLAIMEYAARSRLDEVLWSSRTFVGRAAVDAGLAHKAVERGQVLDEAVAAAHQLARIPASTFQITRTQLAQPVLDRIEQLRHWDGDVAATWTSADIRARLAAQVERLRESKVEGRDHANERRPA